MLYVNSCCCTCFSTENLQNIHNTDSNNVSLFDKLMICLLEKDSIFECAPLLICLECSKHLEDLYNFKNKSLKNLEHIRSCLKQLVRAPFSEMCMGEIKETSASEVTLETIKCETNDSYLQIKQELLEDKSEIKIQEVTSLQKVINPISSKNNKTACQPCRKQFVRYDFYVKHVISCPKNDTVTKNQVIEWAQSNNFIRTSNTFSKNCLKFNNKYYLFNKKFLENSKTCANCKKKISVNYCEHHYTMCKNKKNTTSC